MPNDLTIQRQQITIVNDILKQFKEMDGNIVGNETYLNAPPPVGFIHAYEVVNICKDPAFKEVYPQKGGGLSFTAVALKKLGKAMGIKFAPGEVVMRTYDLEGNTKTIIFRSVACMRGLDSQYSWSTMDYELDLTKKREQIENTQRKNIIKYRAQPASAPPEFKICKTEPEIEEWFKEVVRVEMIHIEQHALTRAQTGSMTRCIRDLGAFPSTYQPAQLDKPFLIPKLVVYYDPVNPLDRAFALEQTRTPMMMFPPPSQKAHQVITPTPQVQSIEAQAPAAPAEPLKEIELHLPSEEEMEEIEKMLAPNLTETEQQIEAEMRLDPIESALLDFEACDEEEKHLAIANLITNRAWKGKLGKDLKTFTKNEKKNFWMMLYKLPPQGEEVQSTLPWSD